MPEPADLRLDTAGGRVVISVGPVALFEYDAADVVMRNIAISALRRPGFTGRRVAAVLGLTESYVATLHAGAVRDGSAALIQHPGPGRPGKLPDADWADAAGRARTSSPVRSRSPSPPLRSRSRCRWRPGRGSSRAARTPGTPGRCCCTRSAARQAPARCCPPPPAAARSLAAGGRRSGDVGLLSATSICFALGAATTEQFKHLTAACAGPLAGLAVLPDLRTLRPRLASIADRCDPADTRVRQLEQRLSDALGQQAWRESGLGAPADIDALNQKITHLEQQTADLRLQLEERDDELSAARAANRELMTRLNQSATPR